jgi:GTP-binding protein Era
VSATRDSVAPRFGEVAIVGRPNVGKSTLLNALIGEKISIVTAKPHTTRQRILGVLNDAAGQAVFVDTPGHARRSRQALHRLMARSVHQAMESADLVMLLVEATGLVPEDKALIDLLGQRLERTLLVVNKIDKLRSRSELLPFLDRLSGFACGAYVPVSARKRSNLRELKRAIFGLLPEGEPMFPDGMLTDQSTAFRAAELIREKLMSYLHQEVPYGLAVEIEHMSQAEDGRWLIHGLIWIGRDSHKAIVIGQRGRQLKSVGVEARLELERLLRERVHLELWVKVREHWSDNERELRRLGIDTT